MSPHRPTADLATHQVTNQPVPLEDYNLFDTDTALKQAVAREAGAGADDVARRLSAYGAELGRADMLAAAGDANRFAPELRTHDRYGHRIDEVAFHPAYHRLMELGIAHRQPSIAWGSGPDASHVAHAGLEFLMHQVEAGVCCPMSMTYAVIPALRHNPDIAAVWEPKLLSDRYDPSFQPVDGKTGATMGMAMTEKQGGSDVRANTTRATPLTGDEYELVGHKWFCSAPMSDAFLTLAYTDAGLTCFFVPRWRPDGTRNALFIQRLKDKVGNRSNASSEIEYHRTWARRVGEDGRGVATIIEMVHHTRLDCTVGAASLMRAALAQAIHHCTHRRAFQKTLIDQPLMQSVLADLALESEAATALALRVARAFDASDADEGQRAFARLAVAVAKYWLNKRTPGFVYEALECHGGAGYVEEAPIARLYREAPLNSIWEGSGNVICLDVLRTLDKEPAAAAALMGELEAARGADARLDAAIDRLTGLLADKAGAVTNARLIVEQAALVLQGALLVAHAPAEVADGFVASRLADGGGRAYGTLPAGLDVAAIVERARPRL